MNNLPFIYIASPYTKGDTCINTWFQIDVFNKLMNDKKCIPYIPLVSHFVHTSSPRHYRDWIDYDLYMINKCNFDACLRLNAKYEPLDYYMEESIGADNEALEFRKLNLPVFYSIENLYEWIDKNIK